MKIRLHNFRCWRDKEIEMGDEGMVLISGPSGRGKTSLLNAIFFALYGSGTKVCSFGCTSCSVELEFKSFLIKRSRRPNRLVLEIGKDGLYEDATAQSIINEKFGKVFDITSYVQQDTFRSFVLMGPLEKLSFLERLLFEKVDIKEIKKKMKELQQHRNEDFARKNGKLEMVEGILGDTKKPEEVSFPLVGRNRELAMRNEAIRYKNCGTRIKKFEREIGILQKELTDKRLFEQFLKIKTQALVGWGEQLSSQKQKFNGCGYLGDNNIEILEKRLLKKVHRRKIQTLREHYEKQLQEYEEIVSQEKETRELRIKEIDLKLWQEMKKDECKDLSQEHREYLQDILHVEKLRIKLESLPDVEGRYGNYENLQQDFESLREKIEKVRREMPSYTCPGCEVVLKMENEELVLAESSVSTSAEELENKLEELTKQKTILSNILHSSRQIFNTKKRVDDEMEDIINSYDDFSALTEQEIRDDLKNWEEYLERNLELEKEKARLEGQGASQSSKTLRQNLDKQEQEIQRILDVQFEDNVEDLMSELDIQIEKDTTSTEEDLREETMKQREAQIVFRDMECQISLTNRKIEACQKEIDTTKDTHLVDYPQERSLSDLQEMVQKTDEKIAKETGDMERYRRNLARIEEYQKYISDLRAYQEKQSQVSRYTRECRTAKDKMAAADLMKTKINEAEAIAISNMIRNINVHASIYLDLFFEEPISVTLLPFKTNQKKQQKPQINVQVDYKSMETDISPLSGGEKDRVVLAYALALSEMTNCPLLLLDECIKSLDSSSAAKVITAIKQNYTYQSGKLVILVAHQTVRGIFDEVIDI